MATALDLYLGPLLGGLVSWGLKKTLDNNPTVYLNLWGKQYDIDVGIAVGVTVLTVILGLAGFPRAAFFVGWTALLVSRMSIAMLTTVEDIHKKAKAADAKAIAEGLKPLNLPSPPTAIKLSYVLVHALVVAYGGMGLFGYQKPALVVPAAAAALAVWCNNASHTWINIALGAIVANMLQAPQRKVVTTTPAAVK